MEPKWPAPGLPTVFSHCLEMPRTSVSSVEILADITGAAARDCQVTVFLVAGPLLKTDRNTHLLAATMTDKTLCDLSLPLISFSIM